LGPDGPNATRISSPDRSAAVVRDGGAAVVGASAVKDVERREALAKKIRTSSLTLRSRVASASDAVLRAELERTFEPMRTKGADRFADWYFAYSTSYRLMSVAVRAAATHALSIGSRRSLGEAVADEVEDHVLRQYRRIVLRPDINDARLNEAYRNAARAAHYAFEEALQELLAGPLGEVLGASSPEEARLILGKAPQAETSVDWVAQAQKARDVPASYEKVPEISLALVAAGAMVGKAAAAKAGGALGGKAACLLGSKLAAPFVAKATACAAPIGAGAGAVAGGPVGAVLGAAGAVALDAALSKGIKLMQRDAFVVDVQEVLDATVHEWEAILGGELRRAVDAWFDGALSCVPGLELGRSVE